MSARWAVRIRCGDCGQVVCRYQPGAFAETTRAWFTDCRKGCGARGGFVESADAFARFQQTGRTQTITTPAGRTPIG